MNEIIQLGAGISALWTVMSKPEVVNKLLDTTSRGFSTLYEAKRIEKIIKKTYDIKGNIAISNGDFSFKVENKDTNIVEETVVQSIVENHIKEIININEIINATAKFLEEKQYISNNIVETDWAKRYFNIAKDISNLEMKTIWSKLLADEISEPGSVSLRTLELLKNLSNDEAKLFQAFMEISLDVMKFKLVPNDEELLNEKGIKFSRLVELQELGLINNSLSTPITPGTNIFILDDKYFMLITNKGEHTIDLPILTTTKIGTQLSGIIDVEFSIEEIKKISESIKRLVSPIKGKENPNIDIKIGDRYKIQDDRINYDDERIFDLF